MTNRVTSAQNGKEISVTAPFNSNANDRFRKLGGKFNGLTKEWVFPAIVKDKLKQTLMDHYFEDGFTPVRRGIIKIEANYTFGRGQGPIRFAGRILGQAKGRDSGARISEGVNLLSGDLKSGGSVKNWETIIIEGSVIAIHDMPYSIIEMYDEDDFEILEFIPDDESEQEIEALEEDEKESLIQRVSDLETRLAEMEAIIAKIAA